jgi:hypothetical protein
LWTHRHEKIDSAVNLAAVVTVADIGSKVTAKADVACMFLLILIQKEKAFSGASVRQN